MSGSFSKQKSKSKSGMQPEQILDTFLKYLPTVSEAISTENLRQLRGTGGEAVREARTLSEEAAPEYYTALGQEGKAVGDLFGAINLSGLSPGESAAVERGLNQYNTATGNAGLTNPTNIVSNAMNFGGAFNAKLASAANAINSGTGFLGVTKPGQESTEFATGTGTFATPLLASVTGAGSSLGASRGGGQSYGGDLCCFIFLEAYYGKLPACIRRIRDKYYKANSDICRGYRRMAKWLVPAMQDSPFVRWLVWTVMIKPATRYSQVLKYGIDKKISHFWLRVWAMYGRNYV